MKIRTFHLFVFFVATFAIGFGNNCFATVEHSPKNYVQGQFGLFQPTEDLDDYDFDSGFDTSISYGRYLTENLIMEGTLEFYGIEREREGFNYTTRYYFQDEYLYVSAALLTLKGEATTGPVDLFGGFGFGVYGATLYSEIDSSGYYGTADESDSDTVFGAHASLGANFNITDYFFLGFEGKYRWTDEVELREMVFNVPLQYEGNLNGYSIMTTVGFRF